MKLYIKRLSETIGILENERIQLQSGESFSLQEWVFKRFPKLVNDPDWEKKVTKIKFACVDDFIWVTECESDTFMESPFYTMEIDSGRQRSHRK